MEEWQEEIETHYKNLLNYYLSSLTEKEKMNELKVIPHKKKAQQIVLNFYSRIAFVKRLRDIITLRVSYPLDFIDVYCQEKLNKGWGDLEESQRRNFLSQLGFRLDNIYDYAIDLGYYKINKRDMAYGEIVIGQERTDRAWINKRSKTGAKLASFAAEILAKKDKSLKQELESLGGTF